MSTHNARCHCQAIQVEVDVADDLTLAECNCSICSKVGYLHLIVSKDKFRLICGEAQLTSYRFNTGVANHLFCAVCGVKVFYIPRSHPDGVSVNARCLDNEVWRQMPVKEFDGRNWEANVSQLT